MTFWVNFEGYKNFGTALRIGPKIVHFGDLWEALGAMKNELSPHFLIFGYFSHEKMFKSSENKRL